MHNTELHVLPVPLNMLIDILSIIAYTIYTY